MGLLIFLVDAFINTFGITPPKPEQKRTVAFVLGGFLLVAIVTMVSLLIWMLSSGRR